MTLRANGPWQRLEDRNLGTKLTGCRAAAAAAAAAAFIPAVGYILCQQRILLTLAPRPPDAADAALPAGVLLLLLWLLLLLCLALRGPAEAVELLLLLTLA